MKRYIHIGYVILFGAACVALSQESNDAVCSQLYRMSEVCFRESGSQPNVALGRVGKAGPRGLRGPPGRNAEVDYDRIDAIISEKYEGLAVKGDIGPPGADGMKGSPGVVDYGRIDSEIASEISQVTADYESRLAQLSSALTVANKHIQRLQATEGICGVKFENKCFWLEIRYDGPEINYEEGKRICATRNGHPANIYSEGHYGEITRYIRAQMPAGINNFYVWLGMRSNPSAGRITLSDGRPAPFLRWHEGHPAWRSSYTNMGMHVRNPRDLRYRDMYDWSPVSTRLGVLCEI